MKLRKLGSLKDDQRGLVYAYIMVLAVVVGVGVLWIIFNEVIVCVGDFAIVYGGTQGADIWGLVILLWRILPVVLILGAFLWAILRATKEEPFRAYPG